MTQAAQVDLADRPVRVNFPVRVVFSGVEFRIKEFTVNVSVGGLFLPTDYMVPAGTVGTLTFRISQWEQPFTVKAEVARTINPGDDPDIEVPGIGIKFLGIDDGTRRKLERLVLGVQDGSVVQAIRRSIRENRHDISKELRARPTDQKVMFAVGACNEEINALIRDGNQAAVLRLLDNPRLISSQVRKILKDRRTRVGFMMALKRQKRWLVEEETRVLYCLHHSTPVADALAQLKTLAPSRLQAFERNINVRPQIRTAAQALLKKRGCRV